MKKLFFIFFLIIALSNVDLKAKNQPEENSFGLIFSIDKEDFSSSGSLGGGIGFQFKLGNSVWLRISTGYDYDSEVKDKPENAEKDWIESEFRIDFKPCIKYNIITKEKVNLYSGIYPLYSYHKETIEGEDFKGPLKESTEHSAGGGLVLGAEYLFRPFLSISAEYSLPFITSWGKTSISNGGNTQEIVNPSKFHSGLKSSDLSFILTFYF